MKIKVQRDGQGWDIQIVSADGTPIMYSHATYTQKGSAVRGAKRLKARLAKAQLGKAKIEVAQ